jgi:hypothetical protein
MPRIVRLKSSEEIIENCGSCDMQNDDEHCISHHYFAQGTEYAKCQEGCRWEGEPELSLARSYRGIKLI